MNDDPWFLVLPLNPETLRIPILTGLQGMIVQAKDENEAAREVTNGGHGVVAGVIPLHIYTAVTEAGSEAKAA